MSSTSSSTASCSDNVCSICLDTCSVASYADGCLHKFCGRCIFEWAQRSQLCPICRTYFATIITNVTSDTEYEVIPLEDRRVPVTNFIRDSWWTNNFSRNGYPSNRNIFAVRQFPQRPNQLQPYQPEHPQQPQPQSLPLPSSSSEPSRTIEPQQQPQVNNDDFLDQATRRFDDLQIDNQPRPERIVWSSQRYSNRQFNRLSQPQQQQPQQLDPQLDPQLEPQPELETDEQQQLQLQPPPAALPPPFSNLRGHNHHINSPRHSPRPLRPLVGIRQETHEVQNQQHYPQHYPQHYQQNQPQYHHHHQHHQMQHHYPQHRHHRQYQHSPHHHHQPHPQHQINLNYQPPHHSYHHHPHPSNSHYSNHHIHPHPNSNHPNPPHPHHFNPHHNPHSYKRLSRPNDRHRRR